MKLFKEQSQKRKDYESPKSEIIKIGPATVLCSSGMKGKSTENVTVSGFDWI